jgi:hypothetical protein
VVATLQAIETNTDSTSSKVDNLADYLDGVETLLTAIDGHVDGLEGFVDGLEGFVDGVETKLDTLHTDLGTTLAGYLDTVETKLQSVIDSLGIPSGGPKMGQVTAIATGADSNFGSQALTRGMVIKNISSAGEKLYLSHAATPTSTNSYVLYPGETTPFIECSNANLIYMRSSTGSTGAASYAGA